MISSPFEDFSGTTLAAIPGVLGKLRYLAELREDDGEYHHWGMERRHGKTAANDAIAGSHSEIFGEILRTPLEGLWMEACELASRQSCTPTQLAQEMLRIVQRMTPRDLRGGGKRHFSLVLRVLSALATSPELKTRQAALPAPPLVQ